MGSLERRIRQLEAAAGRSSGGCERCGDTTVVMVGGEIMSVTKRGHQFPHAAAVEFVAEEQPDSRCPVCGTRRVKRFQVGSPTPSR